jgi:hypothetical protein
MSGGGGGSYTPSGGGGHDTNCQIVRREALTDPDPVALHGLARGAMCFLQLDERGGRARINVIREDGQRVGILFFSGYTRLIECMRRGFEYVAIIESVRGAWCEVEIRNAA